METFINKPEEDLCISLRWSACVSVRHAAKFTQARTSASPHLPTRTYTRALTGIKRMYWPHNLHQHLLWPFPDAHQHYQNVETECAWAVISNSLWRIRQVFCFSFHVSAWLPWSLFLAHRNKRYEYKRSVGTPRQYRVSPANYFAHCPLLFKYSRSSSSMIFFLGLPHTFIDFIAGKLPLFSTSRFPSQLLSPCPTCSPAAHPQFCYHIVTTSKPPCPIPSFRCKHRWAAKMSQSYLSLFRRSPLMPFTMQHISLDRRPRNAHNGSGCSSTESTKSLLI